MCLLRSNEGLYVEDVSFINIKVGKIKQRDLVIKSKKCPDSSNKGKARRGVADGGPDDDGDYATLRELPLMSELDPADDTTSEENKVS